MSAKLFDRIIILVLILDVVLYLTNKFVPIVHQFVEEQLVFFSMLPLGFLGFVLFVELIGIKEDKSP